jgi:hypothetical protein
MGKGLKDQILDKLHEQFGRCSHCGKIKCAGKETGSTLPNTISTKALLEILTEILGE